MPKTSAAIRFLQDALQALENPQEKCRQMAQDCGDDYALQLAFAVGTAQANIKFALANLQTPDNQT
jgi:hypothetical protein